KNMQGDHEAANQWLQQALSLSEGFGHEFTIGLHYTWRGIIALDERNYASARPLLRRALQAYWGGYKRHMLPYPLVNIVRLLAEQNDNDKAVEILGVLHRHPLTFGRTNTVAEALSDQLKLRLEPERFAAAWTRGEERELGAVVVELLAELADE